jgi:membrane protease subunit HflC
MNLTKKEIKMTKNLLIISSIFALILFSAIFTVDQKEQALILQFGEPIKMIDAPGIKFKMPLLQNAVFFDKRIIELSLPAQEVIASDQKRLIINAFVKYRITDPLKFYTTVTNSNGLSNKLSGVLDSSLRQVIGEVTLSKLLTENRSEVMKKIRDEVSESSEIFGIEIVDVRIMRADLPQENSNAIFARMQTEREKEAREIRANGAEISDKVRAEADKQKTIILAEAKKRADLIRGDGEAKATKIYADAYGNDVEFYEFYRSMIAYKESMKSENTKMVVSPNGEFFKHFNGSKK